MNRSFSKPHEYNFCELLLPWQPPGVDASFPTRITSVQALSAHGQPYLYSVSQSNDMSPGLMLFNYWVLI
jgi:hypothetical protein